MKFREVFAVFTPWNEQICSYGYGTLAAIKNKWDTIKSGDKFFWHSQLRIQNILQAFWKSFRKIENQTPIFRSLR